MMHYGKRADKCFDQEILGDAEHHEGDDFKQPPSSNVVSPDFDFEKPMIKKFFLHVFLDVTGHAKIIDRYLSDNHAPYYKTVKADKIQFHNEADLDPDWKVKQCYVLLIAAATEMENGIENLWKHGKLQNCRWYPDFRRFMVMNKMKAFCSVAPYCWSDEEHWYSL